ncbi:transcription factor Opi1-domain-containing protein [Glomus cerebriforme]|uniref:Transcription factor Opi1-domain-containing protein n=1 Tax=Glomus cerebriforme TaxID=658196 RepID=A0A397SB98_9GLOM|nr:transcription factor Opi1-domain-containing protein [Glomus cerebriforme]
MYTQPQTTLPPITAIGNGVVDNYNPSSLTNGDMLQHHIKQEQDFEHSPSLPPIRTNNNNHSRMSINQLCNNTETDYPEEVKEVAEVLENMKSLPPIANISSSPQPQPLEPRTNPEPSQLPNSPSAETGFMSRLGEISIVKRTIDVYEQGKANSPFIKMVESSVSRFSKPVIEQLAIVDQYARGLNKNEKIIEDGVYGPLVNDNEGDKYGIKKDDALLQSESELRKRRVMGSEISRSSSPSYRNPSRPHRTSQSSGSSNSTSYAPYTYPNSTVSTTTSDSSKATRSRWQQMVIGTGAAVGAAGAAVSEESMKSLKYCLQWINYATHHIDAQIVVLKEFIVNLTNPSNRVVVHTSSTSTLASIKKEVIDTLRKVIEVVSKYAGACLPDQAKRNVRSFILNLPTRWASINHTEHSSSSSPISSPQLAPANGHPLNQTTDYARRLLSLATESLDMLRSVAGIFGETVGRAESLLESLKVVGFSSGATTATGNSQYDNVWSSQPNGSSNGYNIYSSSSTSSHSSSGSRSRRSSNSVRMNNHGPRKHSRPTPPVQPIEDDDDSIINGHDSDSSSDSEVESMRMEMDNAQKRALKNANAKSQQQHANGVSNGTKKRKKVGKKEHDRMDLSQ